MDITKKDFNEKYVLKDGFIEIQPVFKYESYDSATKTYKNLTIIKTAQEVKAEYKNATE